MSKLIIEPGKLVTNFKDIEHIVDAVSARMDEPDLDTRKIISLVLTEDRLLQSLNSLNERLGYETSNEENPQIVKALHFRIKGGLHAVYTKESKLSEIIPFYFHELGHIANWGFASDTGIASDTFSVIDEATASAFMYWSIAELSEISNLDYPDAFSIILDEIRAQSLLVDNEEVRIIRAASELLAWQYAICEFVHPKETYHWFKETVYDQEKLKLLCAEVEKHFLKK